MISISNKVSAACKALWLTQFITVGPRCHLSHYPQWWSPRVCKEIDLMASFGLVILRPFNSTTGRSVERQFQLNDLQNQTTWGEHHHPGNMAGTNQILVFSPLFGLICETQAEPNWVKCRLLHYSEFCLCFMNEALFNVRQLNWSSEESYTTQTLMMLSLFPFLSHCLCFPSCLSIHS